MIITFFFYDFAVCHERAQFQPNSEDETLREEYLKSLFASMEAEVEDHSTQGSEVNYFTAHREEQCMVKGDGCYEEEEEEEEEEDEDVDEGDVTYVPENEGDEDEDGSDEVSTSINHQEPSWADKQKTPQLRKPCGLICRKKCTTKITEGQRSEIFGAYWKMPYADRKSFMFHMMSKEKTKRLTTGGPSKRKRSYKYHLKDDQGQRHEVCKAMFLSTLGYHPKNDRLITTVFGGADSSGLAPPPERRGRHTPANKIDLTPMFNHIESFHPSISHYRREHAPNRRYLPSDITIKSMFQDYRQKFTKGSYETYRKAVKELNISFTKLGEEECEHCLRHEVHLKEDHQADAPECHNCRKWEDHKERAESARTHYRLDAEKEQVDEVIRSVDLQKVIMLPRMPGVKTAVFTRRITAFHETFASVGKFKPSKKKTLSLVWHEGIAGRSAAEVASAFVTSLHQERDVRFVTYWVDNCTSQNKNWTLLTTLVKVVNHAANNIQTITLKYFEPGHTFMSADSFHHGVEKAMRKQPGGVVLDFEDFKGVIASSNSGRVNVVDHQCTNFLAWSSGHSVTKLKKVPNLSGMAIIQLRRGSRSMFIKMAHDEVEYTECDFLMKKVRQHKIYRMKNFKHCTTCNYMKILIDR